MAPRRRRVRSRTPTARRPQVEEQESEQEGAEQEKAEEGGVEQQEEVVNNYQELFHHIGDRLVELILTNHWTIIVCLVLVAFGGMLMDPLGREVLLNWEAKARSYRLGYGADTALSTLNLAMLMVAYGGDQKSLYSAMHRVNGDVSHFAGGIAYHNYSKISAVLRSKANHSRLNSHRCLNSVVWFLLV